MHTQVGGFWGGHFHLKYSDQMRLCWGVTGGQKCGEGEGAGPSYTSGAGVGGPERSGGALARPGSLPGAWCGDSVGWTELLGKRGEMEPAVGGWGGGTYLMDHCGD